LDARPETLAERTHHVAFWVAFDALRDQTLVWASLP
jgi:hypothetical protein